MSRSKNFTLYENLDTSFVNLGALLRYLQQRDFTGRIEVEMGDYRAEVLLRRGEPPVCREQDTTTGRRAEGEAALQRLLVRALDAGGEISVYSEEGAGIGSEKSASAGLHTDAGTEGVAAEESSGEEFDWQGLLRTSADLIAAVERAARSTGASFDVMFRLSRLELADDYSFLDPNDGSFQYQRNEIELLSSPNPRVFVSGLCEAMRRVVEKLATGPRAASIRERVALELAVLARRRGRQLEYFGFLPQLDRIAGARVI